MNHNIVSAQSPTFRKSYDVTMFDIAGGMVQSVTGEYLFAGGGIQAILTNIDDTGVVQWSKNYNSGFIAQFADLKRVSTGGYILCGTSSSGGAILTKVNVSGNLIWSMKYDYPSGASAYANAVIETSDGGFLVGGGVDYFFDGATTYDTTSALGFKVNSSGTLLWNKVWPMTNLAMPDEHYINDVAESSDGYFFVGESADETQSYDSDGDLPRDALLIKTDKAIGTTTYIRRWGHSNTTSQGINSAITLASGKILLGGYDDVHAFLITEEGTGASPSLGTTFNRRINGSAFGYTYVLTDIMQNPDGNYSFLGTRIGFFTFTLNTVIVKINSSTGAIIFGKDYAPIGLSSLLPRGGIASDGGYFTSQLDQQITGFNFNVIRTDANGDIGVSASGCTPTDFTPGTAGYSPTLSTPATSEYTSMTSSSTIPVITNVSVTTTVHCIDCSASANAGSDAIICEGSSTTLNASGGGTYAWSPSTGLSATNIANPVASPTSTQTYTVTVSTAAGCSGTDNVTVTVNPLPTVNAGSNQTICVGSTVTLAGTIGGGASSVTWSGGTGSYNPNNTTLNAVYTPSASEVTAGTVTLTLTTDDPLGPCSSVSDNMVITINPLPTVDAGLSQTICEGSTVTLAGTIGGGALSATWSGGTGGYNPNNTTLNAVYTPSASEVTAGTVTLTLTTDDPLGPCSSVSDNMVITINPLPTVDAGLSQTICEGSTVTLAGTIGGGALSATWSGGTGSYNPNNTTLNAVYTPSASEVTAGTVTLTLTTDDPLGPCSSVSDNMVITINPLPTVDAGLSQTICEGSTVTLAGTIGGGASSVTWSGGTGGYNPNNTTLNAVYTPSASEVTAGTVTLTLTTDDPSGPCSSVSDNMVITINPLPTVDAGLSQTICEGSTVTLAGTIGGGALSATWSGGTGGYNPNNTTLNAVYTPSASEVTAGTVTLTLTTDDPSGPCSTASDNMIITINPLPIVNAGSNQTICVGSTVTLAGTIGGGASSATWSGGTGSYNPDANTLNAVYTPSAAEEAAGTITLILTSDDPSGPCTTASDNMIITISPLPTVDAGIDQDVCTGSSVTLSGSFGGAASSATWSGGTGTYNPDSTTLNAIYTPSASEITAGNVTLTLTTNDPIGSCTAVSDNMVIMIYPFPTVNAGTDQVICIGSTVTLSGSIGGSASSASWSGGTGTFNPDATTLNAAYTPSASEETAGTVTLILTTDDPTGPCSVINDNMVITINQLPTVNAGADQTVCEGSTVTLSGTIGGSATSGTWNGGTGSYNPSNTDLNAVYTPSGAEIAAGTVTLTLSTDDPSGPCAAVSDTMEIIINLLPTVDAGIDQVICSGSTITLAGTIGSGATSGTWSGGTGSYSPSNIALDAVYTPSGAEIAAGTVTLTLTTDDPAGPCPAVSDSLVITINTMSSANAGSNSPICEGNTLNLTSSGGINYSWSGPDSFGSSLQNPSITSITIASSGNYIVTVTDANGCSATTQTNVIVNTNPVLIAGSNSPLCEGSVLNLTASGGTTYNWAGPNSFNSTNQNPTIPGITSAESGTYNVTVTNAAGCSATGDVNVTVNVLPNANAGNNVTICPGDSTNLNASGGSAYLWSPSASLSDDDIFNPIAFPSVTTTYTVIVTDSNGCSATDDVTVTISNPSADAGSDVSICLGSSTILNASGGTSYSWSPATGLSSTSVYNPTANPMTTTMYTVTATNASGCTATDNVTVTVNSIPNANAGTDAIICNGTSATLVATGGTSYAWNPGTGLNATNISNPDANPSVTTVYTVTVTDANGCTDSDDITVSVISAPSANAGIDQDICIGDSVSLMATGGGSYLWSTGDTTANATYVPTETTTYIVTVSYNNGCSSSDDVVVTVFLIPTVDLVSDPPDFAYIGQIVTFTALPDGYTTYNFYVDGVLVQTGNSNIYQTNTLTDDQTVSVTVIENNCNSEIDTLIYEIKPIPNAFTPYDLNGKNDIFVKGLDMTVINRWGQILYEGSDGWDGKYNGELVSSGTYYYIIRIEDMTGIVNEINGSITVIDNK